MLGKRKIELYEESKNDESIENNTEISPSAESEVSYCNQSLEYQEEEEQMIPAWMRYAPKTGWKHKSENFEINKEKISSGAKKSCNLFSPIECLKNHKINKQSEQKENSSSVNNHRRVKKYRTNINETAELFSTFKMK